MSFSFFSRFSVFCLLFVGSCAFALDQESLTRWQQIDQELRRLKVANKGLAANNVPLSNFPAGVLGDAAIRLEDWLITFESIDISQVDPRVAEFHNGSLEMVEKLLDVLAQAGQASDKLAAGDRSGYGADSLQMFSLLRQANEHKPRLKFIYQEIRQELINEGQNPLPFWETLNLQDKVVEAQELTPEQRDERFIEQAQSLNPGLTDLANRLISYRVNAKLNTIALRSMLEELLGKFVEYKKQFASASNAEIENALASNELGDTTKLFLKLFLAERKHNTHAHIAIDDFYYYVDQWLGEQRSIADVQISTRVAVNHDGSLIACSNNGRVVTVFNIKDGSVVAKLGNASDPLVLNLDFSTNDSLLIARVGSITAINPHTKTIAFERPISSPQFNGTMRVSSGGRIMLWASGTLAILTEIAGKNESILSGKSVSRIGTIAMQPNGNGLAFGRLGDVARGGDDAKPSSTISYLGVEVDEIFDGGDRNINSQTFQSHYRQQVRDLSFSKDGKFMISISTGRYGGRVIINDLADKSQRKYLAFDDQPYQSVSFAGPGDEYAVAITSTGLVRVWNSADGKLLNIFQVPAGPLGIATGIIGSDLFTAALGKDQVCRFDWLKGEFIEALVGEFSHSNNSETQFSEQLAQEQVFRQILDDYASALRLYFADDGENTDAVVQAFSKLQTTYQDQLVKMGQPRLTYGILRRIHSERITSFYRKRAYADAIAYVNTIPDSGMISSASYVNAMLSAFYAKKYAQARAFIKQGQTVYGVENSLLKRNVAWLEAMINAYTNTGRGIKAVEFAVEYEKLGGKSNTVRQLKYAGYSKQAREYGSQNIQQCMSALDNALKHSADKEDQLSCFELGFSFAYNANNWKLATSLANQILNLDENKKNDKSFMEAARYAYQKSQ